MTAEPLFDRERNALVKLQKLVKDRAAEEKRVADAHRVASEEAEREVQKARKAIVGVAQAKALDELETTHRDASEALTTKYDSAQANADQKRQDLRKKTVDQFSAALDKARNDHKDRLWTADSVHEAGDKEARDRFVGFTRKADAARKHAEGAWDKAAPVLGKVGLSREAVQFPRNQLPPPTETTDPLGKVQSCQEDSDKAAEQLAAASLLKVRGVKGLVILMLAAGAVSAGIGFGLLPMPMSAAVAGGGAVVGGLFLWVLLGILAKKQVKDRGAALGVFLAEEGRAADLLVEHAERTQEAELAAANEKHAADRQAADDKYLPRIANLETQLAATLEKIDTEHTPVTENIRVAREADTKKENARYKKILTEATSKYGGEMAAAEKRFADKTAAADATRDAAWKKMANDWHTGLADVAATAKELTTYGEARYPTWETVASSAHALPETAPDGVQYGEFGVDLYALPDGMPFDPKLNPPDPLNVKLPAYLPFPQKAAVMLRAKNEGRAATVSALQAIMLRFLTGLPPGKVRFTIIDPVGLGENFAAFMHLADYDEKLVTNRIWTEPGQIEQRLEDLTEHMENVIQKYLRNQYPTMEDYNRAAGEVAEPYRVLVIANFPTNFTPDAARRLISVMSSGPACGVCTLLGVDAAVPIPRDFNPADLEASSYGLVWDNGKFKPLDPTLVPFPLTMDMAPDGKAVAAIVKKAGEASKNAARVEVPFEFLAPPPDKIWTGNSAKVFDVPIGRAGATRKQHFVVGRGTSQHALVAGKTGSGKSTFLHAFITNMALNYSPDEAEMYLIDFKQGVEFRAYSANGLPHARVIAIESEREFGLSVLQRLDKVMAERGEWYRVAGANDLNGFRVWTKQQIDAGTLPRGFPRTCPRVMLVVDEFQEFFVEDDKLSQEAATLLDRLVRQGRAFGVHVLLGSQTLGGAFSVGRATIDQMAIRVALQCSEADSQLILSKENSAARLLNRPGEAIYNDANGRVEGNNPFQVVWLSDEKRIAYVTMMRDRAKGMGLPPTLVFEGSATADITKNAPLNALAAAAPDAVPNTPPTVWFGDPVAIKEPTVAVIRPQSAANVLMIGQHEEAALGLMTAALAGLTARLRPVANGNGAGRTFTILDGTPDDGEFADYLRNAAGALGLADAVIDRTGLAGAMADLGAELKRRQDGQAVDRSPRFLLVQGLHRLRELRKGEDDFGFGKKEKVASPGDNFVNILKDGPPQGIHVLAWCDSLTNLNRALDRAALREFNLRVMFQMSASDSSTLLDTPIANKLGKNRALFVEEGAERPEKFRPFGLPPASWLRKVGEQLALAPAVM